MREPRNRAVQVRRFGGPDELEVVDAPPPTAGRGEVRVRVLASGVEYTDVVIRRHLYPQTMRRRPPFVLGYDVVGEIDQLGDGVRGFQLGDRVADLPVLGSNAAYRTLRAHDLTRVPAGVDAAEAAALILNWTTAHQLLHRAARVQRGQRVLVHGAAGAAHDSREVYRLSDEERDAVRVGFEQAERGEFVSDADLQAFRNCHRA
jgi:NADPH:quinone reductase-like Zn-dependent oxidoreductase